MHCARTHKNAGGSWWLDGLELAANVGGRGEGLRGGGGLGYEEKGKKEKKEKNPSLF